MSHDFDQLIDRLQTASVKHEGNQSYFGTDDVLPMWVADMDFAAPPAVTAALQARAQHPVYGYTFYPDSLYQSLIDWFERRHHWRIERDWLLMSPGVVPSLHAAVLAFSAPGDKVIIQPPVYHPFFSCVTNLNRQLALNPLQLVDGRYHIDFAGLEAHAASGAKLLILCSPHNPVGRVWTPAELQQLLAITRRYNMVVLSDEIHADLIYPEHRHHCLATLAQPEDLLVSAIAPSKTFNIAGMNLSSLVVPNPQLRDRLKNAFGTLHMGESNPFSMAAFEAAYNDGEDWLNELLVYLQGNRNAARNYLHSHIPQIRLIEPEGTYLLWLDCRGLGLSDQALKDFFIYRARVGMNAGSSFGDVGQGFMRMNIGCPRAVLTEALERIKRALMDTPKL